jgi:cytochrome c peroxidase
MNLKRLSVVISIAVVLILALSCGEDPAKPKYEYNPTPYNLKIPADFPILDIPEDNPTTVQGVKLGRMLFYDPILHIDSIHSCASCHKQQFAFSSDPTVLPHINLAWNTAYLWNGKIQGTLEDIMLHEVKDFFKTDITRLKKHKDYPKLFFEAFGTDKITHELAAKALAQFERILFSGNSKYDKVLDKNSGIFLTDAELNGYDIFFTEKGDCFHCHGGILFTDNQFHNNALDANPEPGHAEISGKSTDIGMWKTPTLRNIALTAPYMHNGHYKTLEEVVDFYSYGLKQSPTVDPLMKNVHKGGVRLTAREKSDLIAFLHTLTDSTFIQNPELSNPF